MKILRRAGVVTGLLMLLAAPAPAAGPANVTVRVEGSEQTLLARTAVRTTDAPVNKDGEHSCTGTSAAGALEVATGGAWNGPWYDGLGYAVETVRGETHAFPDPDFFTFWLNEKESQVGICGAELQEGDRVLFYVARCEFDPNTFMCTNPPVLPLGLTAPSTVTPGAPFDVQVVEYAPDGTPSPVAGATVSGGDAAVTTGADGRASVRLAMAGEGSLRATKTDRAPSASERVCATDGADGFCGTTKPGQPAPVVTCATDGADGLCGTRDRRAPQARIAGIAEQQRFARGSAPRELRGSVANDPSGLHQVKLRLTRRHRGDCWYFSGRKEAWRETRCGRAFPFAIGDRADWSYLLPSDLGSGRYVLDVVAIDRAFNRDTLARGRNRVVFHVR